MTVTHEFLAALTGDVVSMYLVVHPDAQAEEISLLMTRVLDDVLDHLKIEKLISPIELERLISVWLSLRSSHYIQ